MLKTLFLAFGLFVLSECLTCPTGYEDFDSGCFFASIEEHSWKYAEGICADNHGYLAIIDSCALLGNVARHLRDSEFKPKLGYWVAASDMETEDDWLWSDGTEVPSGTAYWGTSSTLDESYIPEPSGGQDENCLMLSSTDQYYFHDENCSITASILCQADPIASLYELDYVESEKDAELTCPDGFVEISNSCFHFYYENRTTWTEAYHMCQDMYVGSTLAILSDCDVFKAVVDFINSSVEYQLQPENSYWIGGSDTNHENTFTWIDSANTPIALGPPFWGSENGAAEPSGGTSQNCVVLYRDDLYYFHDTVCDRTGGHPLCQTDLISK